LVPYVSLAVIWLMAAALLRPSTLKGTREHLVASVETDAVSAVL
jgi:hypothetical protein